MAKMRSNNSNNLSKIYVEIQRESKNWPSWKKEAYNSCFATTKHAEKFKLLEVATK